MKKEHNAEERNHVILQLLLATCFTRRRDLGQQSYRNRELQGGKYWGVVHLLGKIGLSGGQQIWRSPLLKEMKCQLIENKGLVVGYNFLISAILE